MGRARKNNMPLCLKIDIDLITKLKSINPAIVTKAPNSDELVFRHGALSKYITRLVQQDIDRREAMQQDSLLKRFTE